MPAVGDMTCASCRMVIVDDPSGMCEDCQEGIASGRPGSITQAQRESMTGLLMDQGMVGSEGGRKRRAEFIASVVPGYKWSGDLGVLSQAEAGDVLQALEARRLSQEAKRQ